jgi:hypothetical protein
MRPVSSPSPWAVRQAQTGASISLTSVMTTSLSTGALPEPDARGHLLRVPPQAQARAGDVVRDAEPGDGRAGTTGCGEVEDHPGPDAGDPHARRQNARAAQRSATPRRSRVARPPIAPITPPAVTHSRSRAMSLAPPGTQLRNMTGAAATARTGMARVRGSSWCSDLADDEEDEQRADQVNTHAPSVPRGPAPGRQPPDGTAG